MLSIFDESLWSVHCVSECTMPLPLVVCMTCIVSKSSLYTIPIVGRQRRLCGRQVYWLGHGKQHFWKGTLLTIITACI